MAKKLAPIRVHIWATKHKGSDVWKVAIDDVGGGPLTELKTRYTRKHGAKKGGTRKVRKMGAGLRPVIFVESKPAKP